MVNSTATRPTTTISHPFPLLPTELRHQIWTHALTAPTTLTTPKFIRIVNTTKTSTPTTTNVVETAKPHLHTTSRAQFHDTPTAKYVAASPFHAVGTTCQEAYLILQRTRAREAAVLDSGCSNLTSASQIAHVKPMKGAELCKWINWTATLFDLGEAATLQLFLPIFPFAPYMQHVLVRWRWERETRRALKSMTRVCRDLKTVFLPYLGGLEYDTSGFSLPWDGEVRRVCERMMMMEEGDGAVEVATEFPVQVRPVAEMVHDWVGEREVRVFLIEEGREGGLRVRKYVDGKAGG